MNDETSPSTADRALEQSDSTGSDLERRASAQASTDEISAEQDETVPASEQKKKIKSERIAYLDDLLRSLDILIYAEISVIYYLEYVPVSLGYCRILLQTLMLTFFALAARSCGSSSAPSSNCSGSRPNLTSCRTCQPTVPTFTQSAAPT